MVRRYFLEILRCCRPQGLGGIYTGLQHLCACENSRATLVVGAAVLYPRCRCGNGTNVTLPVDTDVFTLLYESLFNERGISALRVIILRADTNVFTLFYESCTGPEAN